MNLSSAGWEQRTQVDAGQMAAMTLAGAGLAQRGVGELASFLASELADVRLAGMLISQASIGSDVRLELVASLRERINAGTYRIAAADVAQSWMNSARG